MNCARTHHSRIIDYSAVKGDGMAQAKEAITNFVRGIRAPRQNGLSKEAIFKWFRGTPREFIEAALLDACTYGDVRCCRRSLGSGFRANGGYEYVVEEPEAGPVPLPSPPLSAPIPAMARPRRNAGTKNAPGGEWFATKNKARTRKHYSFTLSNEASAKIDRLAKKHGTRAAAVEAAVMAMPEPTE